MISLSPPLGDVREVIRQCANFIENADLAKRLMAVEVHLEAAEKRYVQAGGGQQLFTVPAQNSVAGIISLEEMKWLYKNKFAKPNDPCRWMYDRIRIKAKICPLCNCRPVGTLDHFLAQSLYADFVLTPMNLVPACADCNKAKIAQILNTLHDQTLHPYFDVLPVDAPWLKVEITQEEPVGVVYKAEPPAHWHPDLAARLIKHFDGLKLAVLYAAKASSEIAEMLQTFATNHALYGAEGLRDYLAQQARDRRASSPHSWKAALYDGLSSSDWFVTEGFQLAA